jgi:Ca-activated chloride channel family protein
VIDQVAARGVRVYTVGVGTAEGTVLHIQGRSIRTRLDEEMLKAVASATDGVYYNATNEKDLVAIYDSLSTHLVFKKEQTEITAIFTGVAVVLSLMGGCLSLLWFSRLP